MSAVRFAWIFFFHPIDNNRHPMNISRFGAIRAGFGHFMFGPANFNVVKNGHDPNPTSKSKKHMLGFFLPVQRGSPSCVKFKCRHLDLIEVLSTFFPSIILKRPRRSGLLGGGN